MLVCNLASGSKGNCTFVQASGVGVLVDCGLSLKEVETRLKLREIDPKQIQAVFLTHEHRDHLSGVVAFCHKYGALCFVHERVFYRFAYLFEKIKNKLRVFKEQDFYFGPFTVSPFALSHDSVAPVGFAFYHQGEKVSFATDTGVLDSNAIQSMEGSELVYLEANHDSKMLKYGSYSARLKVRIAGEEGHLSNKACAEVAVCLARSGTRKFVLAHLSEQNNLPQLAQQEVESALVAAGFDCSVWVAKQNEPTKVFEVKNEI